MSPSHSPSPLISARNSLVPKGLSSPSNPPRGRIKVRSAWRRRSRHRDVPSAAVRPTLHLIRGKPRSGRIGGGGLSFGDFSLATQRKVTRPSPKGGRNPVEASGFASCTAKPSHPLPTQQSGRLRLTANRPYDCTAQPCLLATGTESGWTPGCHRHRGDVAAPIGPKTPPSP